MAIVISSLSREYIRVPVFGKQRGRDINMLQTSVKMAFVSTGVAPTDLDWKEAHWDQDETTSIFRAQCLVGPNGAAQLAAGNYDVWVQITTVAATPEIVVRHVGSLTVT